MQDETVKIDAQAVKILISEGYLITDIPAIESSCLELGFKAFLEKKEEYKLQYLQKNFGYAFDGYSYMRQKDSSNQSYEDDVYTFVLSNFHEPVWFPVEFSFFFSEEWLYLLDKVKQIEKQLIDGLKFKGIQELYANMGHMISCNYYPSPTLDQNQSSDERLTAHNDISLFTIFPFGLSDGLQFENDKGNWIDIPACQTMLILSGYLLEFWSKGEVKSLNHRVKADFKRAGNRTSFAFFSLPQPFNEMKFKTGGDTFNSEDYFEAYLAQFD